MKPPRRGLAASLVCALLLAACQGLPVNFSDRLVADRAQIDPYQARRVSGEASGFQLLLLIPISINGRHRAAYDNLLREAGDSLLTDVTVTESWRWAFVGTIHTTTITATAYPRKPAAAAPVPKDGSTR